MIIVAVIVPAGVMVLILWLSGRHWHSWYRFDAPITRADRKEPCQVCRCGHTRKLWYGGDGWYSDKMSLDEEISQARLMAKPKEWSLDE